MEKSVLIQELKTIVEQRILTAKEDLQGLIQSRDGDTKSSAGDKYETSREMVQREIERMHHQWKQLQHQYNQLDQLKLSRAYKECQPGALVQLDDQWILLGPALGKVRIQGFLLLAISMASPIGQLLKRKERGDEIVFQKKNKRINQVL